VIFQAIPVSSPLAKVRAGREERPSVLALAVLLDSVERLSNSNKKANFSTGVRWKDVRS
jgi:hypothetical protein